MARSSSSTVSEIHPTASPPEARATRLTLERWAELDVEAPRPPSPWALEAPESLRSVERATSIRTRKRALFHDLSRLLGRAIDFFDGTDQHHCFRVALLAREIARQLRLDAGVPFYGGLLHDVGGLNLERHVVHHAERGFTDAESRLHPARGAGIIRPLAALRALEPVVAHHHERFDGQGFPSGLAGWQIPTAAAVVALADTVETALRSAPPASRLARAIEVILKARDRLVASEIADAALLLLQSSPGLLEDLHDDDALERRVSAVDEEPPGLENVCELELTAELLWLIARAIDAKHAYSSGHSARVALLAQDIAAQLGCAVDRWDVACAALLHDVGKLYVPRSVLDKVEPLTDEDRRRIQAHAGDTRGVVETIGGLAHLALAASSHHESYDGTGYPSGLAGESIPLIARIISYADVFDALRSDRSFRGGMAVDEALATMRAMVGGLLDPSLATIAFEVLAASSERRGASDDLLGYQRFFRVSERRLVVDVEEPGPPSSVDQIAPWCTVRLGREGQILEGLGALSEVTLGRSESLFEHVGQAGRAKLRDELSSALGGATISTAHATTSGRRIELVIAPVGDELLGHVRRAENTWRSMQELALVHRNFLLSSEAVTFTDDKARIIDVNYAFTRMFGWRAEEVVGKTPKFLQSGVHAEELYRAMRASLVDPQVGAWSGELVNRTRAGAHVVVQLTVNAVRDPTGRVVGYVSNAVDVTERRRAQEALEARERDLVRKNAELERLNQFKSQMVAITSHDLRSPLASIIGVAELLQETCDRLSREELRARLGLIADVGHQLVGLVNDLLDLDKCESGSLKLQPRRVRAEGLLATIAASPGAQGRVLHAAAPQDLTLVADVDRLEQALSNLVGNALKFSPEASPVEVGCDVLEGDRLEFWVADRGPGIADDKLDSVFDRYFQIGGEGVAKPRGSGFGLGLAIVRHIAELHGGTAFAQNRPGGGSRFVVEVPAAGPPSAAGVRASALLMGPRSDDLQLATRVFGAAGLLVLHADRASEAVRRLSVEAPRVAVVDAGWLERIPAALLARARESGTTVLALREEDSMTRDDRVDWELVSPVMDLELSAVVRGVLSRAPQGAR